ncbi:Exopolysaccharide synthesis, ExoD [Devosia equisanguinis]|uniref:Exopolysaccharide synthesis, ExoD n=1 Tax=Devosia equisanguinis TaxID=2490941 RepID=A0A447IF46_9HYPH|nr:exopolysaccharide biosynthesis protein [Devosia equisanguinis]VDS06079.1 Exopolysaccharide synthesis, ExoD [Devosia equisanguinis]
MTPRPRPVTRYTNRIVAVLRREAEGDASKLTIARLIEAMGPQAHRVLILMLTLLNMIPGPPGFGGTIAWTTFAVALAMVLGRPIRLPGIIGRRKLPLNALLKGSEQVAKVTRFVARFSKPRLRSMTGAAATVPYGIFTMVVSVAMTIPIPFINAIPNVGLCVLAFSVLNRDGVGAIAGVLIACIGLVIEVLLILGAINLSFVAFDALF